MFELRTERYSQLLLAHLYGPAALQAESDDLEKLVLRFCIRTLRIAEVNFDVGR